MKKNKIALLLTALTLSITAFAQNESTFDASKTLDPTKPYGYIYLNKPLEQFQKSQTSPEMLKKIQKKFPKFEAYEAIYLPDIKLYEIHARATDSLTYTNEDLSYFIINGELVDGNRLTEITSERNKKFVANFVKKHSEPNQIQAIFGNQQDANRRHIIVFSDPDCPFCKAFDKDIHQNLKGYNITVTYLMNPLYELPGHENALEKAAKIWCSSDKNRAWENWMLVGEMPNNDGTCENPVKEHSKIARSLKLLQTPIIFFDNGYLFQGQATSEDIIKVLNGAGVRPD